MKTLQVDIVSAEASIFSGLATFVTLPGEQGELGVFPKHTPLITRIKPGTVRVQKADGSGDEFVFVAGGILEIQPDAVTVLADTAIRGKDLDEARANQAIQTARDLKEKSTDKVEIALVEAELSMLSAQLAAIRKIRNRI
jgi:F-type H+-transporting ATPase subunit epsilon